MKIEIAICTKREFIHIYSLNLTCKRSRSTRYQLQSHRISVLRMFYWISNSILVSQSVVLTSNDMVLIQTIYKANVIPTGNAKNLNG